MLTSRHLEILKIPTFKRKLTFLFLYQGPANYVVSPDCAVKAHVTHTLRITGNVGPIVLNKEPIYIFDSVSKLTVRCPGGRIHVLDSLGIAKVLTLQSGCTKSLSLK